MDISPRLVAPRAGRGAARRGARERAKGPRATGCDVLVRLNIDTQRATCDDEAAAASDACPLARLGSSTLWTLVKATTAIDRARTVAAKRFGWLKTWHVLLASSTNV